MKTYSAKASDIKRNWYVMDATNQSLGRLAAKIAVYLRGKCKPEYTPHVDVGDFIVLINAKLVNIYGQQKKDQLYYRHTGYPGGIKVTNFAELIQTFPERVILHAVRGMLPKNPLGRQMLTKLKVYADANHTHAAQQPQLLEV